MTRTPPSFRNWSPGEVETAAYLNANVRDAGNWFLQRPSVGLYQSSAQNFLTAGAGAVVWDTEQWNTGDGMHSVSTNPTRITFPWTGKYYIDTQVSFVTNGIGIRELQVKVNAAGNVSSGVPWRDTHAAASSSEPLELMASFILPANAGDYMEVFARQDSGGGLNLNTGYPQTMLNVTWWSN